MWIEDREGEVIWQRSTSEYEIEWMQKLFLPRKARIPVAAAPGAYRLYVEISGMRQGLARRSYDFSVVE